jgi:branched-chain amino acid aminotransferase
MAGPVSQKLYQKLQAVQFGEDPDVHRWVTLLD